MGTVPVLVPAEASMATARSARGVTIARTVALPRPKGWSGDVFLGNAQVGRAGEPIALDEGTYTLVVRNDKVFARTSVPVTVRANETTRPAVALPGLGSLTVQAQPSNCKVYVDGTYVDVTPVLDLPIAAGTHDIRVVFVPTGAAKSKDVTIRADRTERVVVKF